MTANQLIESNHFFILKFNSIKSTETLQSLFVTQAELAHHIFHHHQEISNNHNSNNNHNKAVDLEAI